MTRVGRMNTDYSASQNFGLTNLFLICVICEQCILLNSEQNPAVCDARDDAMKNYSRATKCI
jgi:hypothetical protein